MMVRKDIQVKGTQFHSIKVGFKTCLFTLNIDLKKISFTYKYDRYLQMKYQKLVFNILHYNLIVFSIYFLGNYIFLGLICQKNLERLSCKTWISEVKAGQAEEIATAEALKWECLARLEAVHEFSVVPVA